MVLPITKADAAAAGQPAPSKAEAKPVVQANTKAVAAAPGQAAPPKTETKSLARKGFENVVADLSYAVLNFLTGGITWGEFQAEWPKLEGGCAAGVGGQSFGEYVVGPLCNAAMFLSAFVYIESIVMVLVQAAAMVALVSATVFLVIATVRACRFVLVKSARFMLPILTSECTICGVLTVLAFALVTGGLTVAACVVHGWEFFRKNNNDEDAVGEAASLPFMVFVVFMGWTAATLGRVFPPARVADLRSRILRGVNLSENLGSAFFLCIVTLPPPAVGHGCSCPARFLEAAFAWWSVDVTKLLLCYNVAMAVEVILVVRFRPAEIPVTLLAIDGLQLMMDALSIFAIQGYGGATAALAFVIKIVGSLCTNDKVLECVVRHLPGDDDGYHALP